jgi:hypothetical protein
MHGPFVWVKGFYRDRGLSTWHGGLMGVFSEKHNVLM